MPKLRVIIKRTLVRTFEIESDDVAATKKMIEDYGILEYFNDASEIANPSKEEWKDDCKITRIRKFHNKD